MLDDICSHIRNYFIEAVHSGTYENDKRYVEEIRAAKYLWNCILGHRLKVSLRVSEKLQKVGNTLYSDVVHHKCEESFVCIPLCLEKRGNNSPNTAHYGA